MCFWNHGEEIVIDWNQYDEESVDVLQFWEEHFGAHNIDPCSDYADVLSDLVSAVGDDGIIQLYVTYEEALEDVCDIYHSHIPFSQTIAEEIAETILQKLMHYELVDYPELIPVILPFIYLKIIGSFLS